MDISAHANRARHIAAEPTTAQHHRAEAEGWRKRLRPQKSERLVHPLEHQEAKMLRAERDVRMLEAVRVI